MRSHAMPGMRQQAFAADSCRRGDIANTCAAYTGSVGMLFCSLLSIKRCATIVTVHLMHLILSFVVRKAIQNGGQSYRRSARRATALENWKR